MGAVADLTSAPLIQAIAQLHAEHCEQSSPLQTLVDRVTARAGQPGFVATLTVVVLAWMALNLAMLAMGRKIVELLEEVRLRYAHAREPG